MCSYITGTYLYAFLYAMVKEEKGKRKEGEKGLLGFASISSK